MPTLFRETEGHIVGDDKREPLTNPAQSETPGMLGNSMRENREAPLASGSSTPDRLEKATSYTTSMYASGESDSAVLPAKCPNKGAGKDPRRAWREGHWPRRTNDQLARAGPRAGKACHRSWSAVRQASVCRHHSRQEPYALKCARTDLCGGRPVTGVPTATQRRM